jgi:chemotaxis protein MotB
MAHKAKAHHEEEHENAERWLLTYADLITLLLAVFVVLYAGAEQDTTKFKKLVSAMSQVLNPAEEAKSGPGSGFGNSREVCLVNGDKVQNDPEKQVKETQEPETAKTPLSQTPQKAETLESVQKSLAEEKGLGKGLSTKMTEQGLVINVEEKLLFASGKTDFKEGAQGVLSRLAKHLNKVPNPIQINGHTDNVPIHTHEFPSNWHLSSARAIKTAEFLILSEKMPMQRIHVAGYADTAPAADNATEEGRAKNRRVELVLVKGDFSAQAAEQKAGGNPDGER